ncbi:helix-turn-helix domain-containing protein [Gemmata sp.]|uniref:helix-turn-helix domain-containing protein n=1 Tax=Gemmata sp. TaxID=1914242 RepID=UPI003F70A0BB
MVPLVPQTPSFSDQLRSIIEGCGISRYALCQRTGIAESAMSRFLSGKQGLTLASLDKLAAALGLVLTTGVQQLPQRRPRGRPKKEEPAMKTVTKTSPKQWQALAAYYAKDARENHFSSRRGTWHIEDLNVLCLYNNNPYAKGRHFRDEETAEFRKRLAEKGIKELAYATDGDGDSEFPDYTYAMIIDAGEDMQNWVAATMEEIVRSTLRRLTTSPETPLLAAAVDVATGNKATPKKPVPKRGKK